MPENISSKESSAQVGSSPSFIEQVRTTLR